MDSQTLRKHLHQYIEQADDAYLAAIFQIAEKDESVERTWLTEDTLIMLEDNSAQYAKGEGIRQKNLSNN